MSSALRDSAVMAHPDEIEAHVAGVLAGLTPEEREALRRLADDRPSPELRRRNDAFLRALSWTARVDFLGYLTVDLAYFHFFSHSTGEICRDVTPPSVVAGYLRSKNIGRWQDLAFNQRRRANGGKVYPVKTLTIPEEDLLAMQANITPLERRRQPDALDANDRFAEATRSAAFNLSLGIREIRLLATQPWSQAHWLRAADLVAMQKLIDKGLLIHELNQAPRLSEAGVLLRRLLVLSRHIVESAG